MAQTHARRRARRSRTASAAPARPQVGLGMTLNSIGSIMTQGSLQTTGQWSDLG